MRSHEVYDLADVPHRDRSGLWEEILSRTVVPFHTDVPLGRSPYRASIERRWFDDIALLDFACDPSRGERTRTLISQTNEDNVAIFFAISGVEQLAVDDEEILVTPGSFVTWDTTQRLRFEVVEHFRKITLVMPRVALEELRGRPWSKADLVLDASVPSIRLLRSFVASLAQLPHELPSATVTAARNAALELVAAAVRPEIAVTSALTAETLTLAVERWIARNLGCHDVGAAAAAAAHGVSVRTLQRSFAAVGTSYSAVVRAQRLARARRDLIEGAYSIQAIAHRWGFADASHFCRAFKRLYGAAPTDYRDSYALSFVHVDNPNFRDDLHGPSEALENRVPPFQDRLDG